jgi:DNA-binding CsgD family transcriptional regulator
MARACEIHLTDEERNQLESWVRKTTTEQRMVRRARIVLEGAAGKTSKEIALMLKLRAATWGRMDLMDTKVR